MHSPADDAPRHPDERIGELLKSCPFLVVDLSEGPYYIMGEVAMALRDGKLSADEAASVFAHLNRMAEGDPETQNLLIVGALEILTDAPGAIERTRQGLNGGAARFLFERVLKGWVG